MPDFHVQCFICAAWVQTPPFSRDTEYRKINDRKLFGRKSNMGRVCSMAHVSNTCNVPMALDMHTTQTAEYIQVKVASQSTHTSRSDLQWARLISKTSTTKLETQTSGQILRFTQRSLATDAVQNSREASSTLLCHIVQRPFSAACIDSSIFGPNLCRTQPEHFRHQIDACPFRPTLLTMSCPKCVLPHLPNLNLGSSPLLLLPHFIHRYLFAAAHQAVRCFLASPFLSATRSHQTVKARCKLRELYGLLLLPAGPCFLSLAP